MPFTFAHPAIVLPLRKLPRHWHSLTGLIMGSITPDFEYFIRMRVQSIYSHTWSGLFWFDVPLGMLLTFVYLRFIRDGLIAHLPLALNRRFSKCRGVALMKSLRYVIVMALSVLIGATSHLLWDSFTHPNGYFVQLMPMLSFAIPIHHHYIAVYKLLQHGSTLAGFAFITIVVYKLPKEKSTPIAQITGYWYVILISVILTVIVRLLCGLTLKAYGNLIVTCICGVLIGLIFSSFLVYVKLKTPKYS
jgi:hypothetical protein